MYRISPPSALCYGNFFVISLNLNMFLLKCPAANPTVSSIYILSNTTLDESQVNRQILPPLSYRLTSFILSSASRRTANLHDSTNVVVVRVI